MGTDTEMDDGVWLRDLDGTGSMHVCAKGDPGAVLYRPAAAKLLPVAWMYERGGPFPVRYIHDQRTPAYLEPVDHGFGITSGEWTETPLYALPTPTKDTSHGY